MKLLLAISLLLGAGSCPRAGAQYFSPGNLVVLRLGDGIQALTNSGNTVFLDQYNPNGVLVNSAMFPDTGPSAFLLSGTAGSEGGLNRSLNQASLSVIGYNTNRNSITTSLANQPGAAVPRALAIVDALGSYGLLQASPTAFNLNNARCVAGDGTNNFWAAGGNSGTIYLNPPQSPGTIQNSIANTRYTKITGNRLYFSTQAGVAGIYTFSGEGLPRTSATTNLFFSTGANSQPVAFDINPELTIAYVADQRNNAGGIQRWTNSGSAWILAYTFATGAGAFGVVADFSGAAPIVYATTGESSSNRLVRIVDTNSTAAVSMLALAGGERLFRGIDFAPHSSSGVSPVSLQIERAGTNVVVSWPTNSGVYTLQSNDRVDFSNHWSTVSSTVVVSNGLNQVILPDTNAAEFFRLKQ